MPIEVLAKRGEDSIRFGPLKPVGLTDPRTGSVPMPLFSFVKKIVRDYVQSCWISD